MPNYQKSFIYKICCNDLDIQDIYVGSTTNFKSRKRQHKESCNNSKSSHYNINVYNFIRDKGGWDNWSMILLKELSCNNKMELRAEERKFYEELKPKLNIQTPNRISYYQDCKEIINKKRKEIIICECGSNVTNNHMARHKKTNKHLKFITFKTT